MERKKKTREAYLRRSEMGRCAGFMAVISSRFLSVGIYITLRLD